MLPSITTDIRWHHKKTLFKKGIENGKIALPGDLILCTWKPTKPHKKQILEDNF